MKTVLFTLAAFCFAYTLVFIVFTIRHPHAFDCTDRVICQDPTSTTP